MKELPKALIVLIAPLLIAFGWAKPLTVTEAVVLASERSLDLAAARASFEDATANLAQVQADPTTLIVARTQAQHALELETARWNQAQLNLRGNVLSGIGALLETEARLLEAERRLELSEGQLRAAQARFETGNATELDVARAENSVASDRLSLAQAQTNLQLARGALALQVGPAPEGEWRPAIPNALPELPELGTLLEAALRHSPSMISARNAVALAELRVKLADNDFTPQSALRDAKNGLSQAQMNLQNAEQGLRLNLEQSYLSAKSALDNLRALEASLKLAEETYRLDALRLDAGTITRLDLASSDLNRIQAKHGLEAGVRRALEAILGLESQVNLRLHEDGQ